MLFVELPLVSASNEEIDATLHWVIFRDGPGSWARNVDWDEYQLVINNNNDFSLQLTGISVVDSLGARIEPLQSRRELVRATREVIGRYEDDGLEVRAGFSGATLIGTSVAGAGTLSALGSSLALGSTAAGVGFLAVFAAVPVLATGGVVRSVNRSRVNEEIERRQTVLPISLSAGEERLLHVFFPLAPSPRRILVEYENESGQHTLSIDTTEVLEGLHLSEPDSSE